MSKHFQKQLVSFLLVLIGLPFMVAGFIWSEIVGAFQAGQEFSEFSSEVFDRWFNGNS
jgi:hypothetical protein